MSNSISSRQCAECGGANHFTAATPSGGGHGPELIPGFKSGFFQNTYPKFEVIVCISCGMTRFFVEEKVREQIQSHEKWRQVS